jgi:aminopeptidase N
LCALDDAELHALARQQFFDADNMTDALAAMSAIVFNNTPDRDEVLAAFYQQWQHDPLVIDKWLSIQAMTARSDALQQVQALMEHQAFSIKNPNKVRALIGAFCAGNPLGFHAADGSGYRFLADQVLTLDKLNPQVASRMVTPFSQWRRYGEQRQQLMRAQLERIAATDGLSPDVSELAGKSL